MAKIRYPYELDPKKRRISKIYRRGKLLLYFSNTLLSLALSLLILFSGFHTSLRDFALQYPFPTIVYGFLVLLVYTIVSLPLAFYSSYIYEHQFSLSRYNPLSWLKDFLKFSLISYPIILFMIFMLYYSIDNFSPWWVYAGIIYTIFNVFMNYVYPLIIVPFMWKVYPYKDSMMKEKILNLCRRLGVTGIRSVVVIKESEKSIRPNAVFMGFGSSKRIGLFDNLLNSFTKDEVETVVGHELGHYVNRDILRGLILETIIIFPALFVIDYLVRIIGPALGINSISDISSLVLIGLINGILVFLLMPVMNTHSRWRESEADKFALVHVRKPAAQASTEKRLADMHLSDLKPHPLIEFWLLTHPPTIKRIKMAEEWKKSKRILIK